MDSLPRTASEVVKARYEEVAAGDSQPRALLLENMAAFTWQPLAIAAGLSSILPACAAASCP
jgi:hypothetical protein